MSASTTIRSKPAPALGQLSPARVRIILLVAIVIAGAALRLAWYPSVPAGMNQDEAAAAYEAWSLLKTGEDKWGNAWPAYFPGWGSGQSVLYSYLSLPFLAAFGLSIFSARLAGVILGILTIPLLYAFVRRSHGVKAALTASFLLAVLPWHVMLSRWALECNLLPFFLLLGCFAISEALEKPKLAPLAFLPWAISLYAYGIAATVVPILIILTVAANFRAIRSNLASWIIGLLISGIVAAPLGLFLFKNFVLKRNLGFEQALPFGLPLLPSQRIDQLHEAPLDVLLKNVALLLSGFQDGLVWNTPVNIPPFALAIFPFVAIGLVFAIREAVAERRVSMVLIWTVACMPLLLLSVMNVNRLNAFFIPMLILAAAGFWRLAESVADPAARRCLFAAVAGLLLLNVAFFSLDYFKYYRYRSAADFSGELDFALETARKGAGPDKDIYVTSLPLAYVQVAFHERIEPEFFQANARYSVGADGTFNVRRIGRYVFDRQELDSNKPFAYVVRNEEQPPGAVTSKLWGNTIWEVGEAVNAN